MTRPELVNPTPSGERELLSLLVAFSDELSTAVYRIGGDEGREGMHRLVKRWGPGLSLTHDVVTHILKTALSETGDAFASAQVPVTSLRLLQPHAAGTTGTVAPPPSPEPPKGVDDSAAPGADLLARLTAEVVSTLGSSAGVGLNDIIMMVLETIRRGTGCDRVLLCLVDRDGLRVRARLGVGVGAADLVSKFHFPVSPLAGPIRLAVLKGEDVFVEEVRQSKYEGTTFASVVRSASFALCPLIVRGEVIGCLYFDRVKEPLGLDERMRGSIVTLRQCGSVALSKMNRL